MTESDLRVRVGTIEGRQIELKAERDELSFSAAVEKNAKSAKRIAEIDTELSHLSSEVTTLQVAIVESGKRAAAAQAAARDGEERADAQKALELLDSFARRGIEMDKKFDEAVAEFNALCAEFRQLEKLGYPPTTFNLVISNMKLALKTKIMGTGLIVEHVAPHLRRDFLSAVAGWTASVRNRATARLNKTAAAA
jgi:hypothetical protein